jgi:ferredoxin
VICRDTKTELNAHPIIRLASGGRTDPMSGNFVEGQSSAAFVWPPWLIPGPHGGKLGNPRTEVPKRARSYYADRQDGGLGGDTPGLRHFKRDHPKIQKGPGREPPLGKGASTKSRSKRKRPPTEAASTFIFCSSRRCILQRCTPNRCHLENKCRQGNNRCAPCHVRMRRELLRWLIWSRRTLASKDALSPPTRYTGRTLN